MKLLKSLGSGPSFASMIWEMGLLQLAANVKWFRASQVEVQGDLRKP
jgi:hypothetical protein